MGAFHVDVIIDTVKVLASRHADSFFSSTIAADSFSSATAETRWSVVHDACLLLQVQADRQTDNA